MMSEPILLDRRAKRNKTSRTILQSNIQYDYKLIKTKTNKYYFFFPYSAVKEPTVTTKQVSCDGGARIFQTGYSPQGEVECYGVGVNKTIREHQQSIRHLKNMYFSDKKSRHDKKLRKSRLLSQEKIRNMVADLHFKVANSLCSKYSTIIIPHFGINSMVRSNEISSNTKNELLALSHATFRSRLISKAELRACTVLVPSNECATTKTCGICFSENDAVGSNEIFRCDKCGLVAGRDTNAARNIFIRQLQLV